MRPAVTVVMPFLSKNENEFYLDLYASFGKTITSHGNGNKRVRADDDLRWNFGGRIGQNTSTHTHTHPYLVASRSMYTRSWDS